jgi:hypothetical protein
MAYWLGLRQDKLDRAGPRGHAHRRPLLGLALAVLRPCSQA